MSPPLAWPSFAPNAWVAICATENPNTAAVSAASSASWRERDADLIIDTRRSLVARHGPNTSHGRKRLIPREGTEDPSSGRFARTAGDLASMVMQTTPISAPPSAQQTDRTGRWLASLTSWVLAHKRLVAVGWLALTLVGFYGATQVTDALNENFTMPDSASTLTNERIVDRFDSGGATPPLVAVVTLPPGTTASAPAVRADLRTLEQDLARAVPGARTASFGSTSEPAYVSDDGRTTFAIVHPPSTAIDDGGPSGNEINEVTLARAERAAAGARVAGAEVRLTGAGLL